MACIHAALTTLPSTQDRARPSPCLATSDGFARACGGSVTVEKKLTNFLKKEREAEQDFDSDIVKAYLRKSPFKLVEQPDNMEVQLKRTLGNEECVFLGPQVRRGQAALGLTHFACRVLALAGALCVSCACVGRGAGLPSSSRSAATGPRWTLTMTTTRRRAARPRARRTTATTRSRPSRTPRSSSSCPRRCVCAGCNAHLGAANV